MIKQALVLAALAVVSVMGSSGSPVVLTSDSFDEKVHGEPCVGRVVRADFTRLRRRQVVVRQVLRSVS
jgi:hypothetical protein